MNNEKIKEKIENLRKTINYHNKLYYVLDNPEIEDYEYDNMMQELINLESQFPEFVDENSPTMRVGGEVATTFTPVRHEVQMASLQDVFSLNEIQDFDKKIRQLIKNPKYVVEPKIDGLSVSLEYKQGKFVRASTRGDGFLGEDVTNNIRTIMSVPMELPLKVDIEVRGEVFMHKKVFEKIVEQQELNGEKPFKNPRNAAAGSLRQKNSKVTAKRKLDIFIFNLQMAKGVEYSSHVESLNALKNMGFRVIPSYKLFNNIGDVTNEVEYIGNTRENYQFDIDGAVIKIDSFDDRNILGKTSKVPKWAIAFKYPPEKKTTRLMDIVTNVGRTGVITPTAVFEPIILAGSTVSRAVLHNQDFINKKKIGIGDTIVVRKAGDIIPEVVEVKEHCKDSVIYKLPKYCPSCGSNIVIEESAHRCINFNCPDQLLRNIIHFVSREAMNIDGIGRSLIEKMLDNGVIKSVADLYYLKSEDILNIERMGEKSAENILISIEKSKHNNLSKLLCGLGIKGIGKKASEELANRFLDIEKIFEANKESILNIDGFGDIMAENIVDYFSLIQTRCIIDRLKKVNVNTKQNVHTIQSKLNGCVFVITGTLSNMSREYAKEIIQNFGGKVVTSISKNVTHLLVGENPGSKLRKAQEFNIDIIDEDKFKGMID